MTKSETQKYDISKSLFILVVIVTVMYFAKTILVPIFYGFFLALLLNPACSFFNRKLPNIISISLTFILMISLLSSIFYFFGTQFYQLFQEVRNFGDIIESSINKLTQQIDKFIMPEGIELKEIVQEESSSFLKSNHLIENTITSSTTFLVNAGLVMVYAFLFLLYRNSFKTFVLNHFARDRKEYASDIMKNIQNVAQNYFYGLIIVILILGTLNGIGLYFIGLDYPFLFGYFAAILAIIPYIGTFIGGLLPTIYALINNDNIWTAVFVVLWYIFIQAIEGNILTPKIVGSKVSLNPLVAIIGLITGAVFWGISGMILFIPLIAIIKVLFDSVDSLKTYSILLSSDFGNTTTGTSLFNKAKKKLFRKK
ncbi:MAG: AI-2E family transporter [Bacteroidetes bacterium]|nr:AI-2E family transporter [Bacteroidota bacterium]